MVFFVIGIIILAAGLITGLVFNSKREKTKTAISIAVGVLAGVILIVIASVVSIPTGHTGIVTTFGAVEDYTLEAGIHFKAPWQNVVKLDNRNQKATVDMSCFSSDIQEVTVKYTVNYQIEKSNAQKIYKTIGMEYYNTVVSPRVQEAVKSVMAQYNAESLIANRETLSSEIKEILVRKLAVYNIEVLDASIENLDFTDAFTEAVEAKQVAEQNKLRAEIEQEQMTIEAKAQAERDVIAADAAAEVSKIEADVVAYAGEKEALANKEIAASLTKDLVDYYYAQKWNGVLPEIVGTETVLPILNQ